MTPDDELVLAQQDMRTLAVWWCALNRWDWPAELPPAEPGIYIPGRCRRSLIMDWIDEAIGRLAISREWNRDMSDEEFNDFWRGTYEGHAPSRQRYLARLRARAAKAVLRPSDKDTEGP